MFFLTEDASLMAYWRALDSSAAAVESLDALSALPDGAVVLVDVDAPKARAMSEAFWRTHSGRLRLLAAAMSPSPAGHVMALAAGFRGYAHAYAPTADWRQIVAVVAQGGFWIGADVMQRLLAVVETAPVIAAPDLSLLTPREADVAGLAAGGASNKEIARALDITERTVKAHLAAAFAKLGVSDRLQLALRIKGVH
ncbi:helix-turn-helix transcriptional regulator [Chitinibacteraceae bacterium HSL-7]